MGLALVGLLSGCSVPGGDAPIPNGTDVISADNPIERNQVDDVTTEGRAVTRRMIDALIGGGMTSEDQSFDSWRTCMSAKQFAIGYNPQNGIQYVARIYLTPESDIAKPTGLVENIGEGWETKNDTSDGSYGVFSLNLSVTTTVRLRVVSPCYFVRKVGKDGLSIDELDALGGFAREPWVQ